MFEWNQWGLQNANGPVIEEFVHFHDYLILVLIFIISGVVVFIGVFAQFQFSNRGLIEGQFLEAVWTVLPALILIIVALPSLRILYNLDRSDSGHMSLKVMGHQWFWSYEYTDFWSFSTDGQLGYDAYIVSTEILDPGMFRLLETDNRLILPYLINIRVLIRRADVLHSWALPRLGVKLDATPGRLNQVVISSYRPGIAYGQCSEICGANHRYIPIVAEFISVQDFNAWMLKADLYY